MNYFEIILYVLCYIAMGVSFIYDTRDSIPWKANKFKAGVTILAFPIIIMIAMSVFFGQGLYYWFKTKYGKKTT